MRQVPFRTRAASDVRATVPSVLSQAESIGEICGEFALAAPARAAGISAVFIASGALAAHRLGSGPVAHQPRDRARALA